MIGMVVTVALSQRWSAWPYRRDEASQAKSWDTPAKGRVRPASPPAGWPTVNLPCAAVYAEWPQVTAGVDGRVALPGCDAMQPRSTIRGAGASAV